MSVYKVVLGGGIASGKSTISNRLIELGANLADLDQIAKEVRNRSDVAQKLADAFGQEILDLDGKPISEILAKKAFKDDASTKLLDSICHPEIDKVAKDFFNKAQVDPNYCEIRVLAVPLATLSKSLNEMADEIVCVVSNPHLRLERAIARGMDPQDVKRRIERQASDEELRQIADTVIENVSSIDDLQDRVDRWWNDLLKKLGA